MVVLGQENINQFDIHRKYNNSEYWHENNVTKEYMKEYGIENVRGGSYINLVLYPEQVRYLELVLDESNFFEGKLHCWYDDNIKKLYNAYQEMEKDEKYNMCYRCFSKNHFAKDCNLGL